MVTLSQGPRGRKKFKVISVKQLLREEVLLKVLPNITAVNAYRKTEVVQGQSLEVSPMRGADMTFICIQK